MKTEPRFHWLVLVSAVLLLGALGLVMLALPPLRKVSAPSPSSEAQTTPTEAVAPGDTDSPTRLETLRALLAAPSTEPPQSALRDKANAPHFARLAAESDDPKVVLAALDGMLATYASRPSSKKADPDELFDRAIEKNLGATDRTLTVRALSVAPIALMTKPPSSHLTAALIDMASPKELAARRYAALETLSTLRPDTRSEAVLKAFLTALEGPERQIIAVALYALEGSGPSLIAAPAELRGGLSSVLALVEHADPGVRGRALALFAELSWVVDETVRCRAALGHLTDAEPYVRAQAADLLGRAGRLSAAHPLMALIDDLEPSLYALRGFVTLDGTPGELRQRLAGRPRVADAALHALRELSVQVPSVPALVLPLGGPAQAETDVAESAIRARAWYAAAKSLIPRDGR